MRGLLRRVVPHPDSYPLREDKEFADYRKKPLGLVKTKAERDKSAPDGQPAGWGAPARNLIPTSHAMAPRRGTSRSISASSPPRRRN